MEVHTGDRNPYTRATHPYTKEIVEKVLPTGEAGEVRMSGEIWGGVEDRISQGKQMNRGAMGWEGGREERNVRVDQVYGFSREWEGPE